MIGIFTGMGESALFVCIQFTWTYAKRFVARVFRARRRRPHRRDCAGDYAAARRVIGMPRWSWRRSRRSRRSPRGLCLGLAFSFFATEMMQFAAVRVDRELLVATWAARVALRLVLGVVSRCSRHGAPARRDARGARRARPAEGCRAPRRRRGRGAQGGIGRGQGGGRGRGAPAKRRAKPRCGQRRRLRRRRRAPPRLSPAPRWAPPGAAAAAEPVYGAWPAPRGRARGARRREPGAPGHRGGGARSSGAGVRVAQRREVRAFVLLAAVQAEVFVDPVAPRAQGGARGKIGRDGRRGADAEAQAVRRAYRREARSPCFLRRTVASIASTLPDFQPNEIAICRTDERISRPLDGTRLASIATPRRAGDEPNTLSRLTLGTWRSPTS